MRLSGFLSLPDFSFSIAAALSACHLPLQLCRHRLASPGTVWQFPPRFTPPHQAAVAHSRCRSSVVEHPLGKGEVVCSIHTGSTINRSLSSIASNPTLVRRAKERQTSIAPILDSSTYPLRMECSTQ